MTFGTGLKGRERLAELTGYSHQSIFWFEKGLTPPTASNKAVKVAPWVWQRYKRACEGVQRELETHREFIW